MIGDFSSVMSDGMYLFSWFMMIVALFFTIVSMLDYFRKARELFGFKAKESALKADIAASEGPLGYAPYEGSEADIAPERLRQEAVKLVAAAKAHGVKVSTAESCTGGLIAGTITAVPGSSDVFEGSIVSYSNRIKAQELGVSELTLRTHGAVSENTACEMAKGVRTKIGADVAVSVTGIAGPGGAVAGKPVGTVWIGLADGSVNAARLFHFLGDRDQVRRQTVLAALDLLNAEVGGESIVTPLS